MPKKRRAAKAKPVSDKTRAADDKLREALQKADLRAFDKALEKAIGPARQRRA